MFHHSIFHFPFSSPYVSNVVSDRHDEWWIRPDRCGCLISRWISSKSFGHGATWCRIRCKAILPAFCILTCTVSDPVRAIFSVTRPREICRKFISPDEVPCIWSMYSVVSPFLEYCGTLEDLNSSPNSNSHLFGFENVIANVGQFESAFLCLNYFVTVTHRLKAPAMLFRWRGWIVDLLSITQVTQWKIESDCWRKRVSPDGFWGRLSGRFSPLHRRVAHRAVIRHRLKLLKSRLRSVLDSR